MANDTRELGGLLNRTKERVRKKKILGEGKNFKANKSTAVRPSASNESFANYGGGAKKVGQEKRREQYADYARRQVKEQREINADPQRKEEQKRTNQQALANIAGELLEARRDKRPVNTWDVEDYAQDYIPTDNKLGQAERKRLNQNKAKQFIRNRNK